MSYTNIPIPGGTTRYDDGPIVQIVGPSNHPLTLSIKYHAAETTGGRTPLFGEVQFSEVLEYRWRDSAIDYEDFPQHEEDFEFGLVEIHNSAYVENMASKGVKSKFLNHRLGEGIEDTEVRHFRMTFDDYGQFDIIALNVSVSEIHGIS